MGKTECLEKFSGGRTTKIVGKTRISGDFFFWWKDHQDTGKNWDL